MPDDEQQPEVEAEVEVVHHHHYERIEVPVESFRREPPVNPDPLASYDALWRKQPKRLGFLEFCRAIPGFVGQFPGRVPEDRITLDHKDGQAIFECVCGEVVYAPVNHIEACHGACGRTFAFTGREVCVRREEEEAPAEESEVPTPVSS
jgi:hypothetical protein